MSDFKKKLRQEVVDPAQESKRVYIFKAIAVNSKNKTSGNSCEVKLTNEEGQTENINAEIVLYGNDQNGGWYPKNGESVYVQKVDNKYMIIGIATDNYDKYQELNKIQTDIYSDIVTGIIPSIIY